MKFSPIRALGEVRLLFRIANECTPSWVRILFATSLCATTIIRLNRFYDLGDYTKMYDNLNVAIAISTGVFIIARVFVAYRRAYS